MFTSDNTDGFTAAQLNLVNAALDMLVAQGIDESNAHALVMDNWQPADNTLATLTVVN